MFNNLNPIKHRHCRPLLKQIKPPKTHIPQIRMENGEWTRTDEKKAEDLNSTFVPCACKISNTENDEKFNRHEMQSAISKEMEQKKDSRFDKKTSKPTCK